MTELHDFLYLDVARLHSFVSQIQGGLADRISETLKQLGGLSAGLNVGVSFFSGKAEASKGKESERQQTIQLTDPAYFNVLYQYLRQNDLLALMDTGPQTRKIFSVGQFVEIHGTAELPVIEHWLEQLRLMFDFVERNFRLLVKAKGQGKKQTAALSNQQFRDFRAILDFLSDYINLVRKDPGRQYIRVLTSEQGPSAWCGLAPEHIVVPLKSVLPGEVFVLGRVERMLAEGDTWKLVDLTQFGQVEATANLLDIVNSASALTGQRPISETNLQANYPDFFVTPIAVYR